MFIIDSSSPHDLLLGHTDYFGNRTKAHSSIDSFSTKYPLNRQCYYRVWQILKSYYNSDVSDLFSYHTSGSQSPFMRFSLRDGDYKYVFIYSIVSGFFTLFHTGSSVYGEGIALTEDYAEISPYLQNSLVLQSISTVPSGTKVGSSVLDGCVNVFSTLSSSGDTSYVGFGILSLPNRRSVDGYSNVVVDYKDSRYCAKALFYDGSDVVWGRVIPYMGSTYRESVPKQSVTITSNIEMNSRWSTDYYSIGSSSYILGTDVVIGCEKLVHMCTKDNYLIAGSTFEGRYLSVSKNIAIRWDGVENIFR